MNLNEEFQKQIKNLLDKDYPKMAGLSEEEFIKLLEPLAKNLPSSPLHESLEEGTLPFVIVIKSGLAPSEKAMSKVLLSGKPGITKLFPHKPGDFNSIETVSIPESPAYLLVDIDRGKESLNVTPKDALETIIQKNRSPLTIDEGIAVMTQFPDFLIKNNCFSLLASRHPGDKRVPAIWINAQKRPNLGWCWEGNPHTWLGSASCAKRLE